MFLKQSTLIEREVEHNFNFKAMGAEHKCYEEALFHLKFENEAHRSLRSKSGEPDFDEY